MFSKIIILSLLVSSHIEGTELQTRIANGSDAGANEFPSVVSLRRSRYHICGGTILNGRFVLTAAHCVCKSGGGKSGSPNGLSIQYGSNVISETDERSVPVKKVHCNRFDPKKLIYDVSVLELEHPIPAGNWRPVVLARNYDGSRQQTGVIVGWGVLTHGSTISSKILQKATVDVFTDRICSKGHDLQHHVCLGGSNVGACPGDSGTALFVNGRQVGIASYIVDRCGASGKNNANVYARVLSYYDWIRQIAGSNENQKFSGPNLNQHYVGPNMNQQFLGFNLNQQFAGPYANGAPMNPFFMNPIYQPGAFWR